MDAYLWQDDEDQWMVEIHRVRFGPFDSEDEAREFIDTFASIANEVLR